VIQLIDVTHFHAAPDGPNILFGNINAIFRRNERVGILAGQGAGKTSLARILTGVEKPNKGVVRHRGRVSWPLGFTGWLHIGLSGDDNAAIVARLMGESPSRVIAFCRSFSYLNENMSRIVGVYSPAAKAQFGFALSMAFHCDYYIADETIGAGDAAFRERSAAMLNQRLSDAGLIFLSRNSSQLEKFCDRFLVLVNSQLVEVDSAQLAEDILKLDQENKAGSLKEMTNGR